MGAVTHKEVKYLKDVIDKLRVELDRLDTVVEVIATRDARKFKDD